MDTLWVRMTEIYGFRWTNSFGSEPLETWRKGLTGVSAEQIGHGLRQCIEQGKSWPPTLPKFRELCLATTTLVDYEPWMAPTPLVPALTYQPSQVTAPGDARVHLAHMKQILTGRSGRVPGEDAA